MNRDKVLSLCCKALDDSDYSTAYAYEYVDASIEAKSELEKLFSRHPNWNPEMGWIHFQYDTERKLDMDILKKFWKWASGEMISDGLLSLINLATYRNDFGQYPSEEFVAKVNAYLAKKNRGHVTKETKVSKIIGKIAKCEGLDKIVQNKDISYFDADGVYHSKLKDMGWNYQYAQFCDAINPLKIRRHTLISINSCDFLTMSRGWKWESCHDIRDSEDPGCYSGGTMSYGMDDVSFIAYYIDAEYPDNSDFCLLPKVKRCVFAWDGVKLMQSRVYPDGRDGGDFGLSEEMRSIVQKVIADCLDVPNLWGLKKGKDTIKEYVNTCGFQYPDYVYYDDCTTSWPKVISPELNKNKLRIGKYGICPACGSENDHHESILCESCDDRYDFHCERCGCGIYEYTVYIFIEGVGEYCCEECANRDGWYNVDDDWYREEDLYTDDYSGDEFGDTSEMVETEDGHIYRNSENAELDGYVEPEDRSGWYPKSDCVQDDYDELWYYDADLLVEIDGYHYTPENAERAGYVMDDNGNWKEVDDNEAVSEDSENDAATAEEVAA